MGLWNVVGFRGDKSPDPCSPSKATFPSTILSSSFSPESWFWFQSPVYWPWNWDSNPAHPVPRPVPCLTTLHIFTDHTPALLVPSGSSHHRAPVPSSHSSPSFNTRTFVPSHCGWYINQSLRVSGGGQKSMFKCAHGIWPQTKRLSAWNLWWLAMSESHDSNIQCVCT